MTVKTLIEKLSHYNKDAIVRLHHREGEELLFALAFQNDDTVQRLLKEISMNNITVLLVKPKSSHLIGH